jgi:hypothetical protein
MVHPPSDLKKLAETGVDLCRRSEWEEGLAMLAHVAEAEEAPELPPSFYSFLGYGIARYRSRYREGLSLCEYAVKVGVCDPDNYVNLARTLLLVRKRKHALGVLNRGIAFAPDDTGLQRLRLDMGVRRTPVLPFLSRSNVLNRLLGRLRHQARAG